jgi:hypothetical protein
MLCDEVDNHNTSQTTDIVFFIGVALTQQLSEIYLWTRASYDTQGIYPGKLQKSSVKEYAP